MTSFYFGEYQIHIGQILVATGFVILVISTIIFIGKQQKARRYLEYLRQKAYKYSQTLQFGFAFSHPSLSELQDLNRILDNITSELNQSRRHKRELVKQLISAQQEERKRVAYDLHDGLIQQLVGAHFYLAMVRDKLDETSDASEELERAYAALSKAIGDGRRIIQGLHPTILDDLGLAEAIKELAYQFADMYGWNLTLNFQPLPHTPDKSVSVTIFRVAQEALNNISKHAEAKHVSVQLTNGECIRLIIEDDGHGFDEAQPKDQHPHFGITTMHERVAIIQGTCQINSQPGQGTKVAITVPYELADEIHPLDDTKSV